METVVECLGWLSFECRILSVSQWQNPPQQLQYPQSTPDSPRSSTTLTLARQLEWAQYDQLSAARPTMRLSAQAGSSFGIVRFHTMFGRGGSPRQFEHAHRVGSE